MKTLLTVLLSLSLTVSISIYVPLPWGVQAQPASWSAGALLRSAVSFRAFLTSARDKAVLAPRTCEHLRQQIIGLSERLEQQASAVACDIQREKIRGLRGQLLLLNRSMQQICRVTGQQARSMLATVKKLQGGCEECLYDGDCGVCPLDAASLRRSCGRQIQTLYSQQQQLSRTQGEYGVAYRSYAALCQASASYLPTNTGRVIRSESW